MKYKIAHVLPLLLSAIVGVTTLGSCHSSKNQLTLSGLDAARFDTIVDQQPIALYTLTNDNGLEACITNYGARVVSLMVPDRNHQMRDVVLGFDNIADYMKYNIPFGATIGRNANRIRHAKFSIDGTECLLEENDRGHSLHGGPDGWQKQLFTVQNYTPQSIVLAYTSADGESGFPGEVKATITYTLDNENTLNIAYHATTDKATPINLTNHSYFCLTGDPTQSMMNSSIYFDSDYYAPKAEDMIPTGSIAKVDDTPFDFRTPTVMARCIADNPDFEELKVSRGFGVSMLFNNRSEEADVIVSTPESGIVMEVYTSQPSVQFFSCNDYDQSYTGKNGIVYTPRNAICLETQHLPNAVNVPTWESPIVRPNEVYSHYCNYHFTTTNKK